MEQLKMIAMNMKGEKRREQQLGEKDEVSSSSRRPIFWLLFSLKKI